MPQELPGGGRLLSIQELTPDAGLLFGNVQRPEAPPVPKPGVGAVVSAAFEEGNSVVSLSREIASTADRGRAVAGYSAWDEIKGTPYEDRWSSFVDSASPARTAQLKQKIDEEQANRATLDASGAAGFFASLVAGVADPTILIPVGGELKAVAGGGWSISRSALSGAVAGGLGAAIQETALQSSQETRSLQESAVNVGASVVLGGLLTGGVAAFLSPGESKLAAEAAHGLATGKPTSAGAEGVERATLDDLSISTAEGFGGAARAVAEKSQIVSPNLQAQFSPSAAVREVTQQLTENTLYQTMHDAGRTLGAAVETNARVSFESRTAYAAREAAAIFSEAKKGGFGGSRPEFEEAVGMAMRRNDASDDSFVGRAAQAYRKALLDPYQQESLELGTLTPDDLNVTTADSYLPRQYLKEKLVQNEFVFKDAVTAHYEQQLAAEHAQSIDSLTKRQAAAEQEIADLRMGPDERLTTLAELDRQGTALDAASPDAVDAISNINDLRRQQKAAKDSGNAPLAADIGKRIEAEQAKGGPQLADYRARRRELRARRKRVDLNYAGMTERFDGVMQSLVDLEESNIRSINRVVDKGRAFEREFQRLDPDKARQKLSDLRTSFMQVAEKADKAADRQAEALRKLDAQAAKDAEAGKPVNEVQAARDAAARARADKEIAAARARAERMSNIARRLEAAETFDANASLLEVRQSVDALVNEVSNLSLGRGEKAQRLKTRLENLDPKVVDARIKALENLKAASTRAHDERWRQALDEDGVGFKGESRRIVDDVYDKLTGRNYGEDIAAGAEFRIPVTRGPFKDRTFNVPDALIEPFLNSNAGEVLERYARTASAENELTRKFGRADMRDQFTAIRDDYARLREAVTQKAPEAKEAMDLFVKENGELPKSDRKLLKFLQDREKLDTKNLNALRDLIRGTYMAEANNGIGGRVVRGLMTYNYIRSMGGVVPANLSDLYRPAMVHGLGSFLNHGILPLLTNFKALKMSVEDARLMGLVTERLTQHRLMSMGEMGDPYKAGSAVERLLQNGARIGSSWNGMTLLTDMTQGLSATLSQQRLLSAALNGEKDTRLLAYLGIDREMAGRIAEQFNLHGETSQTLKIANTQAWTDDAATRAYRAAVRKDVDSIIVNKSVGDLPLLANHPFGKAIIQFRTYAIASHQRVLLRGMQESKSRFVGGLVVMSGLGVLSSAAAAWRGGKERWDKFEAKAASNPGYLVGEGLDRSGIFALPVEVGNTAEVLTRAAGFSFNPIKSPILAAGALANPGASVSAQSQRVQGRGLLGATMGPTFGLLDKEIPNAIGAAGAVSRGEKPTKGQLSAAQGVVPFGSYLGMREMLQATTGDSPYAQ